MQTLLDAYFGALSRVLAAIEATGRGGHPLSTGDAVARVVEDINSVRAGGDKVMFIGNGGSAAISSHMAIDFLRNGQVPALAFNDGAALTCLGNDFGYEHVFARQVAMHGRPGDLLFAISSSGRSSNILRAVEVAKEAGVRVVTLSGFSFDNPLRAIGDLNFYLASDQYGFVEVGHQTLIHAVLDMAMGWHGRISARHEVRISEAMECAE
jgi:D-sedoheptulose 7-phosphate isomerase